MPTVKKPRPPRRYKDEPDSAYNKRRTDWYHGQVKTQTSVLEREATHRAHVAQNADIIKQRRGAAQRAAVTKTVTQAPSLPSGGGSITGGLIRIGLLGLVLILVYVMVTNSKNTSGMLGGISQFLSNFAKEKPLFTIAKGPASTATKPKFPGINSKGVTPVSSSPNAIARFGPGIS